MMQTFKVLKIKYVLLAALLSVPACTGKNEEGEPKILARIDKEVITLQEFDEAFSSEGKRYAQTYPMNMENTLRLKAAYLNQLIEEKIILIEGRKRDITVGNEEIDAAIAGLKNNYGDAESFKKVFINEHIDVEKWREKIRKKLFIEKVISSFVSSRVNITPEEVEDYYKSNIEEFHREEQVRARQIFLKDETEASKARERVRSGEDFAAVAKDVSLSPDAAEGGDLGYFAWDVMPPEFDEIVFTLEVGTLSDVVRSSYGYHIFLVEDRREGRNMTFEEARENIADVLRRDMEEKIYAEWINELRDKSKIEINTELIQRSAI